MWIRIDTQGSNYMTVRSHLTQRGIDSINPCEWVLAIHAHERELSFLQLRFPQCCVQPYASFADMLAEFATLHPKRIVKMA